MVKVTIMSGPQAGQVNLVPLVPEDLWPLAWQGWRWTVDYKPLSDTDAFAWGRIDLMAKALSALVRGGQVRFLDQVWQASVPEDILVVAQQVEDYVSEPASMS